MFKNILKIILYTIIVAIIVSILVVIGFIGWLAFIFGNIMLATGSAFIIMLALIAFGLYIYEKVQENK